MMKNSCKTCLYCIPLQNAASILVCTNGQNAAGLLFKADRKDNCRNFCLKDKKPNCPDVTQPADSAVRLIPLTQGKVAIVDAEDYDWLIQYKWYACKAGSDFYARRKWGGQYIFMHRLITDAPDGPVVDHIDGNSLNNTKANLRICTQLQNSYNRGPLPGTSRYKGVYWHKQQKCWASCIQQNKKTYHLGLFNNEEDAAKAYDEKARKLFGEYAYLNFRELAAGDAGTHFSFESASGGLTPLETKRNSNGANTGKTIINCSGSIYTHNSPMRPRSGKMQAISLLACISNVHFETFFWPKPQKSDF